MDLKKIEYCEELMRQCCDENLASEQKIIARNNLFEELMPFIIKWLSSILAKNKTFLSQEELKSLSWDCFYFCLKHYKPNKPIPIPNHFFSYSKFYLQMHVFNKQPKEHENVIIDEEKFSVPPDKIFILDEIKAFRESLEEKYVSVFDDAMNSMMPNTKDRVRRLEESNLTYNQYCESKKIFKIIISFLIRR